MAARDNWYEQLAAIEPAGHAGNASFERWVHRKFGTVLYLFWEWTTGWYFELHGHGIRKKVYLVGTPPGDTRPQVTGTVLFEAHQASFRWEQD